MSSAPPFSTDRALRVLVIGASGNFGGRLVRLLAAETGIEPVLAGRRRDALDSMSQAVVGAAGTPLQVAPIDRRALDAATLRGLRVDAVVDASGPFQAMDLGVPRAAIAAGAHYVDLADSRAFVAAVPQLDAAARAAGVAVLSGASSTPSLSHAALDALCAGWRRIDTLRVTISPSNRQPRGRAVVQAILGGVGQPILVWREGGFAPAHGWGGTRRVVLPGIGRRWASWCDTPDMDLLRTRFRPRAAAEFLASLELPIMHLALAAIGRAVRVGWLNSALPLAPSLHWLAGRLESFGSDWGGMAAEAKGVDAQGLRASARWWLRVAGDAGPNVPVLAALGLLRRLRDGSLGFSGAGACAGVLALDDFAADFAALAIETGMERDPPRAPLFAVALGRGFDDLPAETRRLHSPAPVLVLDGVADVDGASNRAGRALARRLGFPDVGRGVPLRVVIEADADGSERWTRVYDGKAMRSRMAMADPAAASVEERFGPMRFTLALAASAQGLAMRLTKVRIGALALPRILWPRIAAHEHATPGRHHFDVAIAVPLLGKLVRYRGWLALAAPPGGLEPSHKLDRDGDPRGVGDDELALGRS